MWPNFLGVLSEVAAAVGTLVLAGGGIAGIFIASFKWFGEKWLNSKFEERLASYKHAQQKELEQLRYRINALMDRTTKLHQREFEVVPEAWGKLVEAHAAAVVLTSPFQSYPDFDNMNQAQLNEFLENSQLTNNQRDELRRSSDKLRYYQKAIFWHKAHSCKNLCRDFHTHLKKNAIFMTEDIRAKFNDLDDIIWHALAEFETNEAHDIWPRERDKVKDLSEKGKLLMSELEGDIQNRLWSAKQVNADL